MTYALNAHQAVALSSLDLPEAHELLVYSCEDCACPVAEYHGQRARSLPVPSDSRRWVRSEHVVDMRVDQDHMLLFNPAGRGGVAVVNDRAYDIFASVQQPTTIADAQRAWPGHADEVTDIFSKLSRLDLLHPAGQPSRPVFASSQVLTAWLHVSNACNLRCPYCYVSKSTDGMDEAVARSAVDAVMKSAVANRFPA